MYTSLVCYIHFYIQRAFSRMLFSFTQLYIYNV